jgi:hypothetical protein
LFLKHRQYGFRPSLAFVCFEHCGIMLSRRWVFTCFKRLRCGVELVVICFEHLVVALIAGIYLF